ncbi:diguanylate cyclase [Acidaminobacter sp. JC074]|uniref:diguanylate cyclase n=1 Tax=Acidaminobacter sp. JC074 TaxID=2530199 RepID=UPI001F0E8ABD|nr:diguanylate cyclase [Acidaminobacter sp. JC074]MCH4889105.1 diguanylate cyclase [Acidaminobacter sp. JC074]
MKILHVEHSKMIRKASRDIIESLGHEYLESTGVKETFDILEKEKIDLLITGLELDDLDGEGLIELIADSKNSMTPIVVLTSYDNLEIRKKLFNLGVVDYQLKKNFNHNRLKTYINAIQLNEDLLVTMKSLKVAVIDDSILTVKIIQNIFELNKVTNVDYFLDASSLLESDRDYDIYIIDLVLPETTGEALISELKSVEKDNIIIMISSTSNFKTISHILNSGADDFIVKPFDANTFLVRIKNHIKQHILMKELEETNEKLLKVSITDGLTQVFNHKYIIHRLEEECIRSERYDEDLSIILLDLDYFKKVNDTYGHQCGDEVLRRVAETIEDTIRESDIVGRYGGEEFLIILPNTSKEACYQVANKIRQAISEIKFEQEGLKVTISGGVSTYMHFSYSQMIMTADMNLLSAKRNGKDRIE